jgi:HlyD family secretion protein
MEGSKYPFRPGMTASVDILTKRKDNVLSVPLSSVTTREPDKKEGETEGPPVDENKQGAAIKTDKKVAPKKEPKTVIFVNDKGIAKMVEVKTGISDFDNIEVTTGVSDTTEVITGPFLAVSKRLKDGDKVRKVDKAEKKDKDKEGK